MKRTLALLVTLSLSFPVGAQEPALPPVENKEPAAPAPKKSEISEILDTMGYPELQVVPRASERIIMEAKFEDSNVAIMHWPIELSGLATLAMAINAQGSMRDDLSANDQRNANLIIMGDTVLGATWLVGGALLGFMRPYRGGVYAMNKYPGKDERTTLLRERLAEEAMEKPVHTMKMLQYLSVLTNLGAAVTTAYFVNDTGKLYCGGAALFALLPLFFEDHTIEVYERHQDYKRKIYAPIKSASFHMDTIHHSLAPMTTLTWMF